MEALLEKNDDEPKKEVHLRLFDFTEETITELTHYEILGLHITRSTPHDIKQKYRKACLRYHPDKTGRDQSDYVFLAVKSAWDTLSDPKEKQAYDSTSMPFDDAIPSANEGKDSEEDFYETYLPVFERNLRFDARIQNKTKNNNNNNNNNKGGKKNKRNGSKNSNSNQSSKKAGPPSMGDAETSIEEIQEFYDYWTHFESWRDFSMQATNELFTDNNNPLEDAESRYEKRFYQKEIDKRAKQLKRQEMGRIQNLVQRARAIDPRLKRYLQQQVEEKQAAQEEKKRVEKEAAEKKKMDLEKRQKEEKEKAETDKELKQHQKKQREKEKKLLRKSKQSFRKISISLYQQEDQQSCYNSLDDISDDVEFICSKFSLEGLNNLSQQLSEMLIILIFLKITVTILCN